MKIEHVVYYIYVYSQWTLLVLIKINNIQSVNFIQTFYGKTYGLDRNTDHSYPRTQNKWNVVKHDHTLTKNKELYVTNIVA